MSLAASMLRDLTSLPRHVESGLLAAAVLVRPANHAVARSLCKLVRFGVVSVLAQELDHLVHHVDRLGCPVFVLVVVSETEQLFGLLQRDAEELGAGPEVLVCDLAAAGVACGVLDPRFADLTPFLLPRTFDADHVGEQLQPFGDVIRNRAGVSESTCSRAARVSQHVARGSDLCVSRILTVLELHVGNAKDLLIFGVDLIGVVSPRAQIELLRWDCRKEESGPQDAGDVERCFHDILLRLKAGLSFRQARCSSPPSGLRLLLGDVQRDADAAVVACIDEVVAAAGRDQLALAGRALAERLRQIDLDRHLRTGDGHDGVVVFGVQHE